MDNTTAVLIAVILIVISSSIGAGYYYYVPQTTIDGVYEGQPPQKNEVENMLKLKTVRVEIDENKKSLTYVLYNDKGSIVFSQCMAYTQDKDKLKFTFPPQKVEGSKPQDGEIYIKDNDTIVVKSTVPQEPDIELKRVSKTKLGCNNVELQCNIM